MLRVSNSPTIVSNVMVGVAIAIVSHKALWSDRVNPPPIQILKPFFIITIVLLILYFAGMILNDAFDAERDRKTRPNRPIPLGLISVKQAWITGLIMTGVATLLSFKIGVTTGLSTSVLAIAILLYTFLHHTAFFAITLMAFCRALVYFIAVSAFTSEYSETLYVFCGAVALYTAILTIMGSFENKKSSSFSWVIWLAISAGLVPAVMYGSDSPIVWLAIFAFAIWMVFAWSRFLQANYRPISGMHALIAGFTLLDCVLIASIGEYFIMITSGLCFVLTVAAHRKILGT